MRFSWSYRYQGACAREHVTAKRVLVMAWIAIDGRNDMPVVLAESLGTTELGEFDAVHLLVYLGHAFTFFQFPVVDTQGGDQVVQALPLALVVEIFTLWFDIQVRNKITTYVGPKQIRTCVCSLNRDICRYLEGSYSISQRSGACNSLLRGPSFPAQRFLQFQEFSSPSLRYLIRDPQPQEPTRRKPSSGKQIQETKLWKPTMMD